MRLAAGAVLLEIYVFNLQRFSTKDGPGIRTTAFLQGCNLNCAWCHNPESIPLAPRLQYFTDKCVSCGICSSVCPRGAHTQTDGIHLFDEALCDYCGKCALTCPREALKCNAKRYTPEALAEVMLRDKDYYQNSGGGVTVSGGEPMLHADFVRELFGLLKAQGIHTAVDTAANVAWDRFETVLPVSDLFLVDIKSIDDTVHRRFTGAGNALILSNIEALDRHGAGISVRMPLVRGVNDSEAFAHRTGLFLQGLRRPPRVQLLPYHNYGLYKAASYRRKMEEFLPPESLGSFKEILEGYDIQVEV